MPSSTKQRVEDSHARQKLMVMYKNFFQNLSDGMKEDDYWKKCIDTCKECKKKFTRLLQHLKMHRECGQMYSDADLKAIKRGMVILSRENRRIMNNEIYHFYKDKPHLSSMASGSKKYLERRSEILEKYSQNREVILKKKCESYHRNSDNYVENRASYYQQNKEKLKEKRRKRYQDHKLNK